MKKHLFSLGLMTTLLMSSALPAAEIPQVHVGENQITITATPVNSNETPLPGTLANFEGNYYKFIPEETGIYKFYTNINNGDYGYHIDTYGALYWPNNGTVDLMKYDDDGGDGNNFTFTILLAGGEPYYIGVRTYSGEAVADPISLHIEWHSHHADEHVLAKDPTCTELGNCEYYLCKECNTYFEDAGLSKQIFGAFIPALGHNLGDNGICTRCGYQMGTVHLGELTLTNKRTADQNDWFSFNWMGDNVYHFHADYSGNLMYQYQPDDGSWFAFAVYDLDYNISDDNYVEAGKDYYLGMAAIDYPIEKDFNVSLYIPHDVDQKHVLEHRAGVAATCNTPGSREYDICTICGTHFDADGEVIYDYSIPALGHSMKDGECEHGCGLKATEISNLGWHKQLTLKATPLEGDGLWDNFTDNLFYFEAPLSGRYGINIESEDNQIRSIIATNEDAVQTYWDYPHSANYHYMYFEAGQTIYIGVQSASAVSANMFVWCDHDSDVPHSLIHYDAKQGTCTERGHAEYWECEYCFLRARDTELNTFDEDHPFDTPVLGHALDENGKCTRCDYEMQSVHTGENHISIASPNWDAEWESFGWYGSNIFLFHAEHTGGIFDIYGNENYMYWKLFDHDRNATGNYLVAGRDYYIGMVPDSFEEITDLKVTVNQEHEGEDHQTSEMVSGKEPTCTEYGSKPHMVCPICGAEFFIDENGQQWAGIEPIGHDMHDGHCSRCDLSVPELKLGDNTINTASVTDGQNMYWSDFDGNLYTFTAPVAGPFKVETKGEPTLVQLFLSNEQIFEWCQHENVMELEYLEQGQTIFIGIMAKSHQSVNGLTVNLYIPQEGDFNHDGVLSAADVTILINKIMEKDKEGK